jgi:hypothetical protein
MLRLGCIDGPIGSTAVESMAPSRAIQVTDPDPFSQEFQ